MNAIDTNIHLYAFDAEEPNKQRRAQQFLADLDLQSESSLLMWQVAAEFLAGLRRWASKGRIPSTEVQPGIEELLSLYPLVMPTRDVFRRSLLLTGKYQLSHWDSMLIAACIEAGVTTLYSEDLADGMTYESVTVINPLK